MRLLSISDLHLSNQENWRAFTRLSAFPQDWRIVAGDVAEKLRYFRQALALLSQCFAEIFCPLATTFFGAFPLKQPADLRGLNLGAVCREFGMHLLEDSFV